MKKHFFTIYVAVLLSLLTLGIVTGIISHRETVKSKKAAEGNGSFIPSGDGQPLPGPDAGDDFMNIPEISGDDKVPF